MARTFEDWLCTPLIKALIPANKLGVAGAGVAGAGVAEAGVAEAGVGWRDVLLGTPPQLGEFSWLRNPDTSPGRMSAQSSIASSAVAICASACFRIRSSEASTSGMGTPGPAVTPPCSTSRRSSTEASKLTWAYRMVLTRARADLALALPNPAAELRPRRNEPQNPETTVPPCRRSLSSGVSGRVAATRSDMYQKPAQNSSNTRARAFWAKTDHNRAADFKATIPRCRHLRRELPTGSNCRWLGGRREAHSP